MCEAAAVLLGLCVCGSVEVSVTVTPRVSKSARSLPLGGVCQKLELDVALTARGVCVVHGSGGWELLLLLCDNSVGFCCHSHAVVSWNVARREGQSQTGGGTRACACVRAHTQPQTLAQNAVMSRLQFVVCHYFTVTASAFLNNHSAQTIQTMKH